MADFVRAPRKRNHASLRESRLAELSLLQANVNKFSQNVFIQRQKELEAASYAETATKLKKHHENDLAELESKHKKLKKNLEGQISNTEQRQRSLLKEITKAEKHLKSVEKKEAAITTKISNFKKQADDIVAEHSELIAQSIGKIAHEVLAITTENEFLPAQIEEVQVHVTEQTAKADHEEAHRAQCELDVNQERAIHQGKINGLKKTLDDCRRQNAELEESLRKEYKDQLDQDLDALHKSVNNKKNADIKKLKAAHDREFSKLCDESERVIEEYDDLQQNTQDNKLEHESLKAKLRYDQAALASSDRTAKDLLDNMAATNGIQTAAIQELHNEIAELTEYLENREVELKNAQAAVSVSEMEIKAYRLLLETEEDRLNKGKGEKKQTTSRKRKVKAAPVVQEEEEESEEADEVAEMPRVTRSRRSTAGNGRRTRSSSRLRESGH